VSSVGDDLMNPAIELPRALSVVLPVHNEEAVIANVIRRIIKVLDPLIWNLEVLAVNDGSTDESARLLRELVLPFPQLRVFQHDSKLGYGAAVRTGVEIASHGVLVLLDGDDQYDPADLPSAVAALSGFDCVVGYRSDRADKVYRRMLAWLGNKIANRIFGTALRDVNCGLKVCNTAQLKALDLKADSGFVSTEIVAKLRLRNATIVEIPVRHYPRLTGRASGGSLQVLLRSAIDSVAFLFAGHHQKNWPPKFSSTRQEGSRSQKRRSWLRRKIRR
jgi:glycosyltransferase involved in cell wall biosynthesis